MNHPTFVELVVRHLVYVVRCSSLMPRYIKVPPYVVPVQSGEGTEVSPTTSESASFNSVRNKEVVARQNEMTAAHACERILHTHLLGPSNTYMRCRLAGCHNFMRVLITSRTLGLLVRQGYKNRPSLALKNSDHRDSIQKPCTCSWSHGGGTEG